LKREENSAPPGSGQTFSKRLYLALPDFSAHLIFWPLLIIGLTLDLWTKKAVFDWLQHHDSISVIDGFLRLVIAVNTGAAFGLFAGHSCWLIAMSVIALIVILVFFFFSRNEPRLFHVALGLFAAGICGNLYDRVFNDGLVRDFIDVYYRRYHWPAFNVADSLLCIAVVLGIIAYGKDYIRSMLDPVGSIRKFFQRHAQQHK
jgi:signal peptidase II